jgi:hypothetical protein
VGILQPGAFKADLDFRLKPGGVAKQTKRARAVSQNPWAHGVGESGTKTNQSQNKVLRENLVSVAIVPCTPLLRIDHRSPFNQ